MRRRVEREEQKEGGREGGRSGRKETAVLAGMAPVESMFPIRSAAVHTNVCVSSFH